MMQNFEIYNKLSSLSEISKAQLSKILKSIPGNKDFILEQSLIKPLEKVCDFNWLKTNGIQKIYKLESTLPPSTKQVIFMIYSSIKTFKSVVDTIQSHKTSVTSTYHVICIPKYLYVFQDLLEENALVGSVNLYSFQWLPLHLDEGILTLEIPQMYQQLFIANDLNLLPSFGKSLWQLFLVFGKPNFSLLLGNYSNLVMKHFEEFSKHGTCSLDSEFSGIVMMDRSVDYPSAFLTPGTYSGLLNEVYNVQCGHCKHENSNLSEYDEQFNKLEAKQAVNIQLDSKKDSIYRRIKTMYFTEVTLALGSLTKELRSEGQSTKSLALEEMKKYVETKLQSVTLKKKLLVNHLNVAETIISTFSHKFESLNNIESNIMQNKNRSDNLKQIEEFLQTENDKYTSLALLLLLAITQKLSESELQSFLNKYFLEFGYQFGFLYRNLLNSNLIDFVKKIKLPNLLVQNNFFTNANKLKQIPADPLKVTLKDPNCFSYVFGGLYVPLFVQICSLLLSGSPTEELKNKLDNFGQLTVKGTYNYKDKKVLMVCVIGGITYSEISALNLLEKITGTKIVVFSDKIVNKKDIVDAFLTL